jgi:endonuclease/exonuclease/phosphatase (EEP) superfamily protein YafD
MLELASSRVRRCATDLRPCSSAALATSGVGHDASSVMRLAGLAAAVSLALAVLATGCAAARPVAPRAPTEGAAHFVVQTYNVHRGKSGDAKTVDAIGARDAEIVCLQEVTNAWKRVIAERYAKQYPYMLFAPKENAGGLAVLSHFPLTDRGVIPVDGDLHPGWIVVADSPGGSVQLVVVHLRSWFNGKHDWISNYASAGRAHVDEMRLFMGRAAAEMPTIVIGDFNESPRGDAVRALEKRGFSNLLPMFKPGQYTWYARSLGGLFDMTIDHVMADEAFEPLDAWAERRGASDHLPVYGHVALRRSPELTAADR